MAVGKGLVELVDLGMDRLDGGPQLVDEVVLEFADGGFGIFEVPPVACQMGMVEGYYLI